MAIYGASTSEEFKKILFNRKETLSRALGNIEKGISLLKTGEKYLANFQTEKEEKINLLEQIKIIEEFLKLDYSDLSSSNVKKRLIEKIKKYDILCNLYKKVINKETLDKEERIYADYETLEEQEVSLNGQISSINFIFRYTLELINESRSEK